MIMGAKRKAETGGEVMYERILVPLDGSELAEAALPYAKELAVRLGSEITLIHVIQSAKDYQMHEYYAERMTTLARQAAENYLEKPEGKAIEVESRMLAGNPAEEITHYVDREDIDLIVMATHGYSVLRHWALGSVAYNVIRATNRPVVLIRAKDALPEVPSEGILCKMLVPLDGSKESETIVPYVEELASRLKMDVVLLQVVESDYYPMDPEGSANIVYRERLIDSCRAFAKDYLEKIGAQLKQKGIISKSEVKTGSTAREIAKLTKETSASIVAMATHGRFGTGCWIFGSVAEKVLREGNTPLLIVKCQELALPREHQNERRMSLTTT